MKQPDPRLLPARFIFKEAFKVRKITDFFSPGNKPASGISEVSQRGAVSLGENDQEIRLKLVDVLIMNPPFTSADNLPSEYKEVLRRRFSSPSEYARCLTGKLSLQAYFILLAGGFA